MLLRLFVWRNSKSYLETICNICYFELPYKVDKRANIRNWYNLIPHPALNTKWERYTYNKAEKYWLTKNCCNYPKIWTVRFYRMSRVKRICVFEHSVMTNFNCACPAIQRARDLAFCLKVPLDYLLIWASSEGSGETARMHRLAWTFVARIGYKYQIRLTRSIWRYCLYERAAEVLARLHGIADKYQIRLTRPI